ncbi:hypothetical protein D0T84_09550 [Dysgonomonas sp. 521]|uniref:SusE domain-containing protein n=1 Tax=Dysgonomonas sp. 521 TaxID=2302932 RepID=UPI0013D71D99|nr:SusE domain-containing protein [Dysgonomonas sp. 521]NDV95163.1 hypothetical protein [Dysgonomonas sp. 521]
MKIIKYITAFAAMAMMAISCSTDVDEVQISPSDKFVSPVISNQSDVIVNANNSKVESVTFTWTAADFGLPVQILYSVYLSADGNSALLGTSFSTSFSISKADLNGVVINSLGIPANETGEVTAYVTAKINGTANYEAISSNQTSPFNVTTFAAALSWLHLCGEFNGWTIGSAPIFWETTGGSNVFTCMVDFSVPDNADAARSYFKVTAEQNWSGDNWGYNYLTPSWTNPEQADSNLSLDLSEGNIFEITVNKAAMTIDKEAKGKVLSLVGGFNDWGATPDAVFAYDSVESVWLTPVVDIEAGAEIKVRVDNAWAVNWGASGATSSAIPGGYELAAGGDNIAVSDAGSYIVKLHANRTPFVLELVKQ